MKHALPCIALLLALLSPLALQAQRYTKSKRYWSVGGSLNSFNYLGDITPTSAITSLDFRYTRPNLSLYLQHKYSPRLSFRGQFAYGRLAGDDFVSADASDRNARYRFLRNSHFRNDIKELSLLGIYDLFENRNTFLRRPDFVPYVLAGVALFHHNPKAQAVDSNKWTSLQPLGTEGQFATNRIEKGYSKPYSRISLAIPVGVGARYKLSSRLDLSMELNYRYSFTDYLDDVSGNYPAMEDLGSDLARAMSNRTLEEQAAWKNQSREDLRLRVQEDTGLTTVSYIGADGRSYQTVNGFGKYADMRGKADEKDHYFSLGFGIHYLLIQGVRCPKFR